MRPPALEAFYRERGLWTEERIGWLMRTAAERWGEREFLKMDERRYSFAALDRWSTAAAADLVARGVRPGDRVLLHLGNCVEHMVLLLAAWRMGAVAVPVVPIYRTHEMRAIVAATQPAVIASMAAWGSREPCAEIEEVLEGMSQPLVRLVVGSARPGWEPVVAQPEAGAVSDDGLPEPAAADACCLILFTSGTTSLPKGARISSRAFLASTLTWRQTLGLSAADVTFTGAPMAHIGGILNAFLIPLTLGARTVFLSSWHAERAMAAVAEEKATYMAGAPVFLQDLLEHYERDGGGGHRLSIFASGGAPTPPVLVERAERLGVFVMRVYGMTECAGIVTMATRQDALARRARTDGKVAFGAEVQIVDDDHRALPFGTTGNIRLRTPQLIDGYTDAEATSQQIDSDGWFYPGDVGSITEDGWLTMSGRTKDIINRGGEKFSAQDIEAALAAHPSIRRAAVVGVPHARLGEAVGAFVILAEGRVWTGPEEVLAHLEAIGMARAKFPTVWHVVDAFPATASGKVQKHKLLEIAAAGSPAP